MLPQEAEPVSTLVLALCRGMAFSHANDWLNSRDKNGKLATKQKESKQTAFRRKSNEKYWMEQTKRKKRNRRGSMLRKNVGK